MATQILSLIPTNATDADFRNWGKPTSDALTAFQLTKTTDTGQIDWNTVLKPATANTYQGYEIRKFTDSLQPVFFKIEYGAGGSATSPSLRFSFGTGSDGAGTITAPVAVAAITNLIVNGGGSGTTPQSCYLSGSGSRFGLGMFVSAGVGFYICAGRSKNQISGQDTNEALLISRSAGNAGITNYYFNFTSSPVAEASGIVVPTVGGSGADGTDINIYPNYFYRGGTPISGLNSIGIFNNDFQGTNPVTLTVLGGSHSYYFLGGVSSQLNTVARGGTAGTGIGMLFE